MKVAIVTSVYPPDGTNGGNAAFFSELSQALSAQGHEVLVCTLTEGLARDEMIGGIRVVRAAHKTADYRNFQIMPWCTGMSWNLPRSIALYRDLVEFVDQFAPDVIECVDNGFEGLFWALTARYPLVLRSVCPQFHTLGMNLEVNVSQLDKELITALEVLALRRAQCVTTPSASIAGIIADVSKIPLQDIRIIRNPLRIVESETRLSETRSVHEADAFNIVYIGRVEKLKGCDILIEALPLILKEIPAARLTMIGNPSPFHGCDGNFADVLKARLNQLGLLDRCVFTGSILRSQLSDYTQNADICVFPSRYDSSPYACLEAMAQGLPVVASRVGGIPEYVEDGVSGLLFESENPHDLAMKVIELALNTELRTRIRVAAGLRVRDLCAPHTISSESVQLYREAIDKFGQTRLSQCYPEELDPTLLHLVSAFDAWTANPYLSTLVNDRMSEAWQSGYEQGVRETRRSQSLGARIIHKLKRMTRFDDVASTGINAE